MSLEVAASPQQQGERPRAKACEAEGARAPTTETSQGTPAYSARNATAARDRAALRTAMGHRDRAGGCGGANLPTDPRPAQQGPQPADHGTLTPRVRTKIGDADSRGCAQLWLAKKMPASSRARRIGYSIISLAVRCSTPFLPTAEFMRVANDMTRASTPGC